MLFLGNNGYVNAPQCYVNMYTACLVFFWKMQTANPESVAPSHHFHVNDRPNSGTMVLLSHWFAKTDLTEEDNTLLPSEWRTTRFLF